MCYSSSINVWWNTWSVAHYRRSPMFQCPEILLRLYYVGISSWLISLMTELNSDPSFQSSGWSMRPTMSSPTTINYQVWSDKPIMSKKDTHHSGDSTGLEVTFQESGTKPELSLGKAKFYVHSLAHSRHSRMFSLPGMLLPCVALSIFLPIWD